MPTTCVHRVGVHRVGVHIGLVFIKLILGQEKKRNNEITIKTTNLFRTKEVVSSLCELIVDHNTST